MTRAAAKQVEIGGLDSEADETQSITAGRIWRKELWLAIYSFAQSYVDAETGLKKYEGCAYRLNKRWEDEGRPVTGGALKNAVEDANRNNFRLEWAFWFAEQDADIARLLGCKVKAAKTVEQERDDLKAEVRETLSHKEAEKLFRRAAAR